MRLVGLEEIDDLFPGFRRLKHYGAVVAFGEFPETLWACIRIIQSASETFGNHSVASGDEHRDGPVVGLQMFFRRETVGEYEADGKNHHVRLTDRNKAVVWREQDDACDFVGMFSREISRDAGAEGFADKIGGSIRGQQRQCFIGGIVKRVFGGFSGTIFVARIFDDEHVKRRGGLNNVGVVATLKGAAGVAVGDEHLALRGLHGRQAFPTDGLAAGIGPTREILRGGVTLDFGSVNLWRKVDQPALEAGATEAKNDVYDNGDSQCAETQFPQQLIKFPQ